MTARFCKFAPDGRIQFIGEVPVSMLALQGTDAMAIDDTVGVKTHYVDVENLAVLPMGEQPSEFHAFDYTSKSWVDPRTLQNLKDAKWEELKKDRDRAELRAFTYNGMVFNGDLNAQRRLSGYISISKSALATGQPFSATFTLLNNQDAELSATDFVGIELAKAQDIQAVFAQGRELRAQVYSSTTEAEISAISWS